MIALLIHPCMYISLSPPPHLFLFLSPGSTRRPALGVHCAADAQARQLGIAGVLVIEVSPGGAAEAAGVVGTTRAGGSSYDGFAPSSLVLGDVIKKVGGAPVSTVDDLLEAVEERAVGDAVSLELERGGAMPFFFLFFSFFFVLHLTRVRMLYVRRPGRTRRVTLQLKELARRPPGAPSTRMLGAGGAR